MCGPTVKCLDIFNISLTESVIPTCFKHTTIVPVPKEAKVTCLNDYRPVALTSEAMKCFERLAMAHINSIVPDTLDPLQFAYRPNRSTDDAISIALHTALSHLDRRNPHVRLSFNNYSSAFTTIVPTKRITKLRTLRLNISLTESVIPTCFKQTTIAPVPKKAKINDYHPVALMSVAMKCFEKAGHGAHHLHLLFAYHPIHR